MQFVKSIVYLLEQVQCIYLDLCIYNILRNTEETSSKHHTTTTYVEPPKGREEEGRETRGRETPKTKERKMGYTRRDIEKMAPNRQEWRTMADGPCSQRANRPKYVSRNTEYKTSIGLSRGGLFTGLFSGGHSPDKPHLSHCMKIMSHLWTVSICGCGRSAGHGPHGPLSPISHKLSHIPKGRTLSGGRLQKSRKVKLGCWDPVCCLF